MMKPRKKCPAESITLVVILLMTLVSGVLLARKLQIRKSVLKKCEWLKPESVHNASGRNLHDFKKITSKIEPPRRSDPAAFDLLVGELRVIAIGSSYPIPYDAETCPFTGALQPALDQLDRDGDGMTDEWELRYGLNKYDTLDASTDVDGDGFGNHEEFLAETDPTKEDSHPPYAKKLRFVRMLEVSFPLIFQGASELPDGRMVFQLNTPADGKSHFRELGEDIEGIVLEHFIQRNEATEETLFVLRGNREVALPRGKEVLDPESQVELINILDHSTNIATMGTLLSLRNDVYTVVGVWRDRISVRHHETGEVYDIVGFAKGEREALSGGFEE